MRDPERDFGDAARFLFAGVFNTLCSLFIYQAFLFFMAPALSYAFAWTAGLAFVVAIHPNLVFPGGRRGLVDRLLLAATYACLFLAGLGLLQLFVVLTAAPRIAIIATLAITTPASFLLSRLVLRRST